MANSQRVLQGVGNRVQQIRGGAGSGGGTDSLRRRDRSDDTVAISFRYLDSTRNNKLDSSIRDFTTRFPVPAQYIHLGNLGNAAKPLLFQPMLQAGWDPGFHSFDIYKWQMHRVRFFNTTKPYSEINYLLGSRVEQVIELLHTQNLKPNWNALFQYRLINSPGFFKNQKTNHNNYLVTSVFESVNKRYHNYFVLLANKLQSAENGGMVDTVDFLKDAVYKDRFNIPTQIGGDDVFSSNFFSNKFTTANNYRDFNILLRQQYDLGKKDSLVTDSTVIPLFFPRLRFEHSFSLTNEKFFFFDNAHETSSGILYRPDSAYYNDHYGLNPVGDTVSYLENWRNIQNDFSIYQFPDAKNLHQFIRVGLTMQNLTGWFTNSKDNFYNLVGHAEYRNRSKNLKWDITASGKLWFVGLNSADYEAHLSLQRFAGKRNGYIQLGFDNTNRSPSFIFDKRSSFYLSPGSSNFNKENNTHLFAAFYLPVIQLKLEGHYYLLSNFSFIENFRELKQASSLFNVLHVGAQKTLRLGRNFNWHADIHLQQVIGSAPVNLPAILMRNRIAYEGNLGFRNLDLAGGLEIKYRSPYKADNYSPVLGQFFFQDSLTVKNELPEISFYTHFRIRPFKCFFRVENLHTLGKLEDGTVGFFNNTLVAPGYAMPGLQFRLGIYWNFVN